MAEQDPVMMAVDSSGATYQVEEWKAEASGGGGESASAAGGGATSGEPAPAPGEFLAICVSSTHGPQGWAGSVLEDWWLANEQVIRHNEENAEVPFHSEAYVTVRYGGSWRGPVDPYGGMGST
jgi:hypothetical protein